MSINAFALYWFVFGPAAVFCLQYGWDMFMDDVVPMASKEGE